MWVESHGGWVGSPQGTAGISSTNLMGAINALARNAQRNSESSLLRTHVRKPDTFDGTNPKKLHAFLVQCELNFQDR